MSMPQPASPLGASGSTTMVSTKRRASLIAVLPSGKERRLKGVMVSTRRRYSAKSCSVPPRTTPRFPAASEGVTRTR